MKKTLLIFLVLLRSVAWGQNMIVGRVTSGSDKQSLAGVNVVVKGTTIGTTTDAEGKFSIEASPETTLVFSFIGYAQIEIVVGGQSSIEVALAEDITTLSQVTIVSTGYQQLPKERATGSFVQIDQQLVNRKVSTDIISRLEDVTSGLIFNRNITGKVNDISIRGTSTIFSNTAPLIIIDNFPYDGDINTINPNDVESMTVLKDAAAASIWGSRAGNGVIVITTKKGKLNQGLKAAFNSNVTVVDKPDVFYASRMSSSDFIDVEKKLFDGGYYGAIESSFNNAPLTPAVELFIANRDGLMTDAAMTTEVDKLRKKDVRNDISKYLYRKAVKQQYAVNLTGGTQNNKYYFSTGVDKNQDNVVGNGFQRVTLNAGNTWTAIKNRLELTTNVYYSESDKTSDVADPSSIRFTPAVPLYPYASFKNDDGSNAFIVKDYRTAFVKPAEANGLLNWQYSPLDEVKNRSNTSNLVDYRINGKVRYMIIQDLYAEVLYQYWRSVSENRDLHNPSSYYSRDLVNQFTQMNADGSLTRVIPAGGILDLNNSGATSHNVRGQLSYSKQLGVHEVNALVGYEVKDVNTSGSSFRYYGYNDDLATNQVVDYVNFYTQYNNTGNIIRVPNADSQSALTDRFVSYFANASYSLKKRYTLSGSARKDQSNLFGVRANQKGVPLWSGGLAWNVNEESFYHFDALPYLKVRATYGYNGNINKSVTAYTTAYMLGFNYLTGLPYATITNAPNPNLRWERVKVLNFGVDFETKNRIASGSIEYYNKWGLDLIGTTPFPPSTGISSFTGNTANTRGRGVDVILNTTNIDGAIKWTTNFLFTYLVEKVTSYKSKADASAYLLSGDGSSGLSYPLEGKPLYALYSYKWAGLDPATGDPRSYVDGQPSNDYATIVANATPENIVYHGSARPTSFGSLRNTVTWKSLSLSCNVSYRLGYYFRRNSIYYNNLLNGQVEHGDYALRWQNAGDEQRTDVPSVPAAVDANRDNVYLYSSALVEKGDHVRLQDITLSYSFKRLGLGKVVVYGYVNNLGIIWKASKSYLDPDYLLMKPQRSYSIGVRIEF